MSDYPLMTFGERLRELREEKDFSQADLATALNLSQAYVSALERRSNAPREELLVLLGNYFGVAPAYFITGVIQVNNIKSLYPAEIWIDDIVSETITDFSQQDTAILQHLFEMREHYPIEDEYLDF